MKRSPLKRGKGLKRKSKSANSKMKTALDDAAREIVRERDDWTCQRCGSKDEPQWSHVITREYLATRWDPDNAKILCRDCHCWWGSQPGPAYIWFSHKWPDRWERINRILLSKPKIYVKQVYAMMVDGVKDWYSFYNSKD